jgi:hypothetical protein
VYGPVRTVVWEDGGREAPSYPIVNEALMHSEKPQGIITGLHRRRLAMGAQLGGLFCEESR